MARRLTVSAWRAGASATTSERLERAFRAVLDFRAASITDAEHHAFLHPARTALILSDDVGLHTAALAAAPLVESLDRALRPAPPVAAALLDAAGAALLAQVPLPTAAAGLAEDRGDADALLLEQLVTAATEPCLLALAEHLDQARHLHLRLRLSRPSRTADPDRRADPPGGAGTHAAIAEGSADAMRVAADFHRRATAVYLPVARRAHPLLAARLERWAGAFERRFLRARP